MTEPADINPPILRDKRYEEDSAFSPDSLLREARRQRRLANVLVPPICILDPDGDLVRWLEAAARATRDPDWACYHTALHRFSEAGLEFGVVPFAVGSSFAVLVAEELFACGCELLISMTSSGQLVPRGRPPYFILIEQALRDEGTSYHYLPPAEFSVASAELLNRLEGAFDSFSTPVHRGSVWTTDAPFRETSAAIHEMKVRGLLAVEMEAAALYAFAEARSKSVICFAHVTNQMGVAEGDFDKGEADGAVDALNVIATAAAKLLASREELERLHIAPGTFARTSFMRAESRSSVARSSPYSFRASVARTPEISSSTRIWIGWVAPNTAVGTTFSSTSCMSEPSFVCEPGSCTVCRSRLELARHLHLLKRYVETIRFGWNVRPPYPFSRSAIQSTRSHAFRMPVMSKRTTAKATPYIDESAWSSTPMPDSSSIE